MPPVLEENWGGGNPGVISCACFHAPGVKNYPAPPIRHNIVAAQNKCGYVKGMSLKLKTSFRSSSAFPILTAALAAAGLISTAQAQVQVGGELLVDVNATTQPIGPLTAITNAGTMGGFFQALGGGPATPVIGQPNTNSARGIVFDGSDYLQQVVSVGGALTNAPDTLVGANPTCSIEVWVINPSIPDEETIVSWGYRGGPDGSNMSFNYGSNGAWGAVGHWGAPDLGWVNGGGAPAANVWHLLVYTYDGTTQRVYSDGVELNSEVTALNIHAGTPILMGAQYDNSSGAVTAGLRASATLARLRVHSEALTPSQVADNYNLEKNEFTLGPAVFLTQPQNVVTQETRTVSFTVTMQGQPPIGLQWYKNNAEILGATGTTLVQSNVMVADSGSQFFAVASNFSAGSSFVATSAVATLTVLGDTSPPTVLQVRVNGSTQLELVFSEAIRPADAANAANFVLSGPGAPTISGASAGTDPSRVLLMLSGPLTACDFYSVAVSGVHDASPSGNLIATGTSFSFWNYALPGLAHRYTFNNPPTTNATAATVPDLVGTADGTVKNNGGTTTFTGSRITLSGGPSATAPYIDLPNGLLSQNSTNNGGSGRLTFEGWVKVTGIQGWSRVLDFGSTIGGELNAPGGGGEGRDYLFYSAMNGTDATTRQIDFTNHDPTDEGAVNAAFSTALFNVDYQFVITWDEATGQIRMYENGVQVASMVTDDPMSGINDVNVWLGRSNWTVDANMQGEFDEFRTYNTVLGLGDIQRNYAGGPDNNFGSLLALNLSLATNNMVTNTLATVRVLASFSTAGTQDVASSGCVLYSSTDSNIVYITSDGVIRAGNVGTATVTATLGGLSNSEVIVVTEDATPPALVSARANSGRLIEITFSELLDPGTAGESGNYVVSGPSGPIAVSSAVLLGNQSNVVLTLDTAMPCEYITVLVSFIADQSPLFNQIAENSPISFMNFLQGGLQHRYTFNGLSGAPSGTVTPDGVGTADGVILGTGAALVGDSVALPGGPSGSAAYVDLPNGLLSTNGVLNGGSGKVSLETWVRVTGQRTWSRIYDFGSSGPCCNPGGEVTGPGGGAEGIDYFMLSAQVNTDVSFRRLEIQNRDNGNLGNLTTDYATTNFNRMAHIVVTWDERTRVLLVYENGVMVKSATSVAPMSSINDVNVWLGRSNWAGDQNMQGEFDEFRIYNRILTSNQVTFNGMIGPDNTLGQPVAFNVLGPTNVQIGSTIPVAAIGDFSVVSNVNLSAAGCAPLQSSNPAVITVDAFGVHAVGLGTASVSAQFNGTTTNITITVGYLFQLVGTPGASYSIQTSPQVTGPWTTIATRTASPAGIVEYEDTVPRGPQAFYRGIQAPPP